MGRARRERPFARPLADTCRSLAARAPTDLPLSAATALWSAAESFPPWSSRIVTAGLPNAAAQTTRLRNKQNSTTHVNGVLKAKVLHACSVVLPQRRNCALVFLLAQGLGLGLP